MGSLEIVAKKGFFSKKLTDLFKPYIRGTDIEAHGIKIPSGKFHLQFAVADVKGNQTVKAYRLLVKNNSY